MAFVCSYCGYESDGPGDCPECEITLVKEEEPVIGETKDKGVVEDDGSGEDW